MSCSINDSLSWKEISKIDSLEKLVEREDQLPSEIDLDSLNENNFQDFMNVIEVMGSHNKDVKRLSDTNTENESICESDNDMDVFKYAYGTIPLFIGAHEALHAIGAKLTGGDFLGFGVDSTSMYTTVTFSSEFSKMFSTYLPNFLLTSVGVGLMKKGWEEDNSTYFGIGTTSAFLNAHSFLIEGGDYYSLSESLLPTDHYGVSVALGAGLALATYGIGYTLSEKYGDLVNSLEDMKDYISDFYR